MKNVFLPIIIAATLFSFPVQASDFRGCHDCHGDRLAEESTRYYLHSPFSEQRCGACHEADNFTQQSESASAGPESKLTVQWLGESPEEAENHWFLLPDRSIGERLIVDIFGDDGFYRHEVDIPPLEGLPEARDTGRLPVISGLKVKEVQRDVFLKAHIEWETDTLTRAQVRYGTEDLSQSTKPTSRFGLHHHIVLYELEPDRNYRFSVVSTDLFGRSQVSDSITFSTAGPFTAIEPRDSVNSRVDSEKAVLKTRFQRIETDYLIEMDLGEPSSVFVGTGENDSEATLKGSGARLKEGDDPHIGLSGNKEASMAACRACHQKPASITHPVGVYPKPGMVIPPEYPTLPDGRITCRTCHEAHGSNYAYLTIKSGRRELCIGCHRDMI